MRDELRAAAMAKALADVAARDRLLFPELYEKVDAILADPNRDTHQHAMPPHVPEAECAWCGDFYVPRQGSRTGCCSVECRRDYRRWLRQREEEGQ